MVLGTGRDSNRPCSVRGATAKRTIQQAEQRHSLYDQCTSQLCHEPLVRGPSKPSLTQLALPKLAQARSPFRTTLSAEVVMSISTATMVPVYLRRLKSACSSLPRFILLHRHHRRRPTVRRQQYQVGPVRVTSSTDSCVAPMQACWCLETDSTTPIQERKKITDSHDEKGLFLCVPVPALLLLLPTPWLKRLLKPRRQFVSAPSVSSPSPP